MGLSGTVIDRITRVGDIGERGYSVYGQRLPYCSSSGSQNDFHGATQDGLTAVLPTCYITESVYSYLTPDEVGSVTGRIMGIVSNNYSRMYSKVSEFSGRNVWCWGFVDGVEARPLPCKDPCKDVSCPDKCVGVDKFDQVCQDGICVRGTLIETNSEHCGYTPEPTPDPSPAPSSDTYIVIIALMLAGTYMILRR